MTDWAMPYTCQWRVFEVNTETWADAERVTGFAQLKVNEDLANELLQTGSMALDVPSGEQPRERYLRVALTAESVDSRERVDVCTMLWRGTSGTEDRGRDRLSLVGSSVLYPASRTALPDMYYAPQGANGAEFAADMLRSVLAAPVEVIGSGFTIDSPHHFGTDKKVLAGVRELLGAGNHVIQITGRGTVTIMPRPTVASLAITRENARIIANGIGHKGDPTEIHNRIRVVDGNQQVTVENDDPASLSSHAVRGYWDDVIERNPTRVNGETLTEYARRRLEELSVLRTTYTYGRRWYPDVHAGSLLACGLPQMRGTLRVARQTITCDRSGISLQEESYREDPLWQR